MNKNFNKIMDKARFKRVSRAAIKKLNSYRATPKKAKETSKATTELKTNFDEFDLTEDQKTND